ncbi:procathepsin L-like [Rhineura floridana]|uniref:procathepsin L-like n=1 Tax=Rhineura floridana TaxID=261503 RepID=UPI002AC86E0F|nr:procathepsin L-like [Rhineura floridana]
MHLISVLALTGLVLLRAFATARDPALDGAWRDWKLTYSKEYRERNEDFRRSVWENNLQMIEEHNREASQGKHTFQMAMNHLGDLTREEFNEQLNGLRPDLPRNLGGSSFTWFKKSANPSLPESVDWRTKGYVTPVKDQGSCGSCWAFGATGTLEGFLARTTGRLVSLSEQNLVDCSWAQGNQGCNGGWPSWALDYVRLNNGINSENTYPYEARDANCRYKSLDRAATCSGYVQLPQDDEEALEEAVATIGPIAVALDASYFQFYSGGVFYYPGCGQVLNHAVLAVGYGTTADGVPFWIIKNSWGPYWGDNGYILLLRGSNHCRVASVSVYPV